MKEQSIFSVPLFSNSFENHDLKQKEYISGLISYERSATNENLEHVRTWQTPSELHINNLYDELSEHISSSIPYIRRRFELDETETLGIDNMYGLSMSHDGKMLPSHCIGKFIHGFYVLHNPGECGVNFSIPSPDRSFFPNIWAAKSNDVNCDEFTCLPNEGDVLFAPAYVDISTNFNKVSKPFRIIYFTIRSQI